MKPNPTNKNDSSEDSDNTLSDRYRKFRQCYQHMRQTIKNKFINSFITSNRSNRRAMGEKCSSGNKKASGTNK